VNALSRRRFAGKHYTTPIFTSAQNQVHALRALKAKRIVGATYFSPEQNQLFANYFTAAEMTVLSTDGVPVKGYGRLIAELP
jgi:maleate cis-trans isomerase